MPLDRWQSSTELDTAFLNPLLLLFLILPIVPYLLNFLSLQHQSQEISNQTFNLLLLRDYQPLTTGPETYNP